ncbi:hypothetical protein HHI36_011932 [Cryptolaemus montrouzieri]|uniref:YEATS domain-containing protein n=1 Tax=Cryptolaemus montrouzieri TaxID=559131 RepID=A0ABD2NCS6_9CUCU
MNIPENYEDIDPDYASHNVALKRAEKLKEENQNSVEKVKEILNEEFNKELSQRQNQIEYIEKQIHKTQKLLHLLRYVLISSYYNRKELEYNGTEDTSKGDTSYLFDQNRIHPALKKLLGKNNSAPDLTMCRSARRNKTEHKPNLMVENLNSASFSSTNSTSNKSSTNNFADSSTSQQTIGVDRNRQKIKNRIIVGNISKWMPSYEDDNLTHKWMMYVRGPKDSPDVSHFIDKVVFFLHPSYKPHDVVEVCEPPFHLSRRGWGEFPIRVQIHFRCTLNKPVDIVHNLKLDKTYSGRQTLGNESIIDLYLYDDKITNIQESEEFQTRINYVNGDEKGFIKKHEIVAVTDICEKTELQERGSDLQQECIPNFEHDYCTEEDIKPNVRSVDVNHSNQIMNMDHCYSYPSTHEFLNIETKCNSPQYIEQEENALIYGLDESYSESHEDATNKEPLYYRKTLVYTTKPHSSKTNQPSTSQSRGKAAVIKRKPQESLLRKMFNTKINAQFVPTTSVSSDIEVKAEMSDNGNNVPESDNDKFQIVLPRRIDMNVPKFKNIGEVLPYLFKRLPLISELARNLKYRSVYPFTACSLTEYVSWNIAKQSSAEWSRAKAIKNIIVKENIHEHQKWSTKAVMMYGRSHGFTPKPNYSLFEKNTSESKLINACFKSSIDLPFNPQVYNVELPVDIVNESDVSDRKRLKLSTIDVSDPTVKLQCSYIRAEALESGVVLKNEQIDDNIVFNGAERMIFEAVKCFADHLVRRSLHHAVCDGNYNTDIGEINPLHVDMALKDRKEFDVLAEFRSKQSKIKYFFH